jgi:hypothetical protein
LLPPAEASIAPLKLASGETAGWLVRSTESLAPQLFPTSTAFPFAVTGRTTFALMAEDGEAVATHWLASADGTTALIYAVATGTSPGAASAAADLQPIFLDGEVQQLLLNYVRDHQDAEEDIDHILDRPYQLSGGSRDPVEVFLDLT